VKGLREPVHVFEIEGVGALRTRFDASRARGLARFVGRADEMGVLDAAFTRAREGHGQAVGVVAEAGTGKSRLCFEFAERCRERLEWMSVQADILRPGRDLRSIPAAKGAGGSGEGDWERASAAHCQTSEPRRSL